MQIAREALEHWIEHAIRLLDDMDGDPDFELQCEDEGFDSDSEPNGDDEGNHQPMVIVLQDDSGRQIWPPRRVS